MQKFSGEGDTSSPDPAPTVPRSGAQAQCDTPRKKILVTALLSDLQGHLKSTNVT